MAPTEAAVPRVTLREYPVPAGFASARRRARPRRRRLVHGPGDRASSAGSTRAPAGRARSPLGEGSAPHGVIVGPDGAPWITDGGLNAIVRVDPRTRRGQGVPAAGLRAGREPQHRRLRPRGHALVHRAERLLRPPRSRDRAPPRLAGAAAATARTGSPSRPRATSTTRRSPAATSRRIDVRTGRATRARAADARPGRAPRLVGLARAHLGERVERGAARACTTRRSKRWREWKLPGPSAAGVRRVRRRARHRLGHRLRRQRAASASTRRRSASPPSGTERPARTSASSSAAGARSGAPSPASTGSSSRGAAADVAARAARAARAVASSFSVRRSSRVPTSRAGSLVITSTSNSTTARPSSNRTGSSTRRTRRRRTPRVAVLKDEPGWDCTVTWVPPAFLGRAAAGMSVNPDSIRWLSGPEVRAGGGPARLRAFALVPDRDGEQEHGRGEQARDPGTGDQQPDGAAPALAVGEREERDSDRDVEHAIAARRARTGASRRTGPSTPAGDSRSRSRARRRSPPTASSTTTAPASAPPRATPVIVRAETTVFALAHRREAEDGQRQQHDRERGGEQEADGRSSHRSRAGNPRDTGRGLAIPLPPGRGGARDRARPRHPTRGGVRSLFGMHRLTVTAVVALTLALCSATAATAGPTASPSAHVRQMKAVVHAWSKRLNAGDNNGLAHLFRLPAVVIQNDGYGFHTYEELAEWHSRLPCGGRITSIVGEGPFRDRGAGAAATGRAAMRRARRARRGAVRDRRAGRSRVGAGRRAGEPRGPTAARPRARAGRRSSRGGGSRVASPSRTRTAAGPRHGVVVRAHRERVAAGRRDGEDVAAARLGQLDALDQQVARLAVLAGDGVRAGRRLVRRGSRAARCSARRRARGAGCRRCRRRPRRRSSSADARLTEPTV